MARFAVYVHPCGSLVIPEPAHITIVQFTEHHGPVRHKETRHLRFRQPYRVVHREVVDKVLADEIFMWTKGASIHPVFVHMGQILMKVRLVSAQLSARSLATPPLIDILRLFLQRIMLNQHMQ